MEHEIGSEWLVGFAFIRSDVHLASHQPRHFLGITVLAKEAPQYFNCCISVVQVAKIKHFPRLYWKTACTDLHKNVLLHIPQFSKTTTKILLLATE